MHAVEDVRNDMCGMTGREERDGTRCKGQRKQPPTFGWACVERRCVALGSEGAKQEQGPARRSEQRTGASFEGAFSAKAPSPSPSFFLTRSTSLLTIHSVDKGSIRVAMWQTRVATRKRRTRKEQHLKKRRLTVPSLRVRVRTMASDTAENESSSPRR